MASLGEELEGVACIDISTDNLSASIEFYTEVLGGKLLDKWNVNLKGDGHSKRIFGHELNRAQSEKVDPWTLGVPDITGKNSYEVQWRFVLFDNVVVKLVQYIAYDGNVLSLRDEITSPAICPNPHLCFWVGDVDLNKQIRAIENAASNRQMPMVYFNRTAPAENEDDRAKVPEDKLANEVLEGEFAPLTMAYFKGPTGEQLELLKPIGSLSDTWNQALSDLGVPSTAYLAGHMDNQEKRNKGITAQFFGMNHIGIRVKDMERSIKFYCEVLGGHLLPMKGDHLQSDTFMNVLFQKEMLEAKKLGRSFDSMYIPDARTSGSSWVNVRLVQFGSASVELLEYCTGNKDNPAKYDSAFNWTSPAYTNTMTVTFAVREAINFPEFLQRVSQKAEINGFPGCVINSTHITENDGLFNGKALEGYDYSLAKGPSGEHIAFCRFSGVSRKSLHDEIARYHGVSPMFDDLNPMKL